MNNNIQKINDFAQRLVLTERQKPTRKQPIAKCMYLYMKIVQILVKKYSDLRYFSVDHRLKYLHPFSK